MLRNKRSGLNYRYSSAKEQQVIELIDYVLTKNYGETIPLREAAKILQYNIDDEGEMKRFKSMMSRIKNALIDKGYVLKSITNVGYYIMKPKQVPDYTYRTYTLRTLRLLEKQDRILAHIDTSELSTIRLKENEEIKSLNKVTYEAINTCIDTSSYFENKNFYNGLDD